MNSDVGYSLPLFSLSLLTATIHLSASCKRPLPFSCWAENALFVLRGGEGLPFHCIKAGTHERPTIATCFILNDTGSIILLFLAQVFTHILNILYYFKVGETKRNHSFF